MDWITTKQASELSGYNRDYITRLAQMGKFAAKKVEGRWWVERESFLLWVEEQRKNSNGRVGPRGE